MHNVTLKKFLGTITAVIILSTLAGVGISYLILSNKQAQVNNTKLHISSESNMAIVDENTPINVPDNSENLTQPYPEPATEKKTDTSSIDKSLLTPESTPISEQTPTNTLPPEVPSYAPDSLDVDELIKRFAQLTGYQDLKSANKIIGFQGYSSGSLVSTSYGPQYRYIWYLPDYKNEPYTRSVIHAYSPFHPPEDIPLKSNLEEYFTIIILDVDDAFLYNPNIIFDEEVYLNTSNNIDKNSLLFLYGLSYDEVKKKCGNVDGIPVYISMGNVSQYVWVSSDFKLSVHFDGSYAILAFGNYR